MELEGIGVDLEYLKKFELMLKGKCADFQDQLDTSLLTLGAMPKVERALRKKDATQDQLDRGITHIRTYADSLNINSPKQVVEVLNNLGFPTKSAAKQILEDPPFSVESLSEAAERWGRPELDHSTVRLIGLDVIENIQQLRSGSKALSSFVVPLQGEYINGSTGRVHTSFNQLGTSTGRFSSQAPNVQQMPSPKREGAKGGIFDGMNVRRAFLPPPGYDLLVYDYDAMELRILAEITGDAGLIASTLAPDMHRANASIMFGKPAEEITDIEREIAKTIIYTIVYGGGPKRVSHLLRCSIERAKDIIALLYDAFPEMAKWIAARKRMAVSYGYSLSMSGRKRYYDVPGFRNQWGRPYSKDERRGIIAGIERRGQNMPIQATSADIVKLAMVWVDEAITPHGGKLLLQIHDELVAIAPSGAPAEICYELMGAKMIEAEQEFLEVVESKVKGHRGQSWEH
jgi:DNA polymerase-1